MILVVGATGQLGSTVVRRLVGRGRPVRALVREGSNFEHLRMPEVELCFGDLRDAASLRAACSGVSAIVATATVVFPRGIYSFRADEAQGYRNLLDACRAEEVGQLVYTSILGLPERFVSRVPTLRFKREVEELIAESGVPYTVFRAGPFMDDYFALLGSSLPLRGTEAATLLRPFWLSRLYRKCTGTLIDDRGVALVPGRADARHSFIALDDVASYLIASLGHPAATDAFYDIGGPRAVSWAEVVKMYSSVLGRPVRACALLRPRALRLAMMALRPFSEAAANQLGILWALSQNELVVDPSNAATLFGVTLQSAEDYLKSKAAHLREHRGSQRFTTRQR